MSTAQIFERGYRRYDGERLGLGHSIRSLMSQTLRRILGLHRPARSKVLPILCVALAYLPAITFVGLVALLPNRLRSVVPSYPQYYGFITAAIILFVLFAVPEALCPDRRSRVLSLYLASPLNRWTYLLAKTLAILSVLLLVTIGPPLILLVGLAVQGAGPDGLLGFLSVLGRILASGLMLSLVFTTLAVAVSSLTDRRAVAAGCTTLLLFGSGAVGASLHFGAGVNRNVLLLAMNRTPFEAVIRIYGAQFKEDPLNGIATVAVFGAVAVYTVLGALVAFWRYQRLQVTR